MIEVKVPPAMSLDDVETWKMLGVKNKRRALEKCTALGLCVKESMISTRKLWEVLEADDPYTGEYRSDNGFDKVLKKIGYYD